MQQCVVSALRIQTSTLVPTIPCTPSLALIPDGRDRLESVTSQAWQRRAGTLEISWPSIGDVYEVADQRIPPLHLQLCRDTREARWIEWWVNLSGYPMAERPSDVCVSRAEVPSCIGGDADEMPPEQTCAYRNNQGLRCSHT